MKKMPHQAPVEFSSMENVDLKDPYARLIETVFGNNSHVEDFMLHEIRQWYNEGDKDSKRTKLATWMAGVLSDADYGIMMGLLETLQSDQTQQWETTIHTDRIQSILRQLQSQQAVKRLVYKTPETGPQLIDIAKEERDILEKIAKNSTTSPEFRKLLTALAIHIDGMSNSKDKFDIICRKTSSGSLSKMSQSERYDMLLLLCCWPDPQAIRQLGASQSHIESLILQLEDTGQQGRVREYYGIAPHEQVNNTKRDRILGEAEENLRALHDGTYKEKQLNKKLAETNKIKAKIYKLLFRSEGILEGIETGLTTLEQLIKDIERTEGDNNEMIPSEFLTRFEELIQRMQNLVATKKAKAA